MAEQYEGRYFDGKSAARHDIGVAIDSSGLYLTGGPFAKGRLWQFNHIKLLSHEPNDRGVNLTRIDDPDIRLTIVGTGAWDAVTRRAPDITANAEPTSIARPLLITAAIAVVLAVVYFVYPYFSSGVAKTVPQSWAQRIGDGMIAAVASEEKLCTDADGTAVLTGMVAKLVDASELDVDIRVQVVDHRIQNALAAPGGRILVFRGLIQKARSAEEVAGVIAHEIGHTINRHPLERLVEVFGLQLFFGSTGSDFGGLAGTVTVLSYGREAEAEADSDGVLLLNRAGVSADALAGFFDRLGGQGGYSSSIPSFLSSHPKSAERARIIRAADRVKSPEPLISQADWEKLQAICDKGEEAKEEQGEE